MGFKGSEVLRRCTTSMYFLLTYLLKGNLWSLLEWSGILTSRMFFLWCPNKHYWHYSV